MGEPNWAGAEDVLFERSASAIRQFAAEHPDEVFAALAFTVDSVYAGVGLNFDTLENSLAEAQRAKTKPPVSTSGGASGADS